MIALSLLFKQIKIFGLTTVQKYTILALNTNIHEITRSYINVPMVSERQDVHTIWTPCFKERKTASLSVILSWHILHRYGH
jgi:hypothetical protein